MKKNKRTQYVLPDFDTFAAPNPDFQIGERAPLSINPRNTPGFSPGYGFILMTANLINKFAIRNQAVELSATVIIGLNKRRKK
jgi:hypothetical protein